MASFLEPIKSTALVVYDPTLPHAALRSHSEKIVEKVYKRSLEIAKFETEHLRCLSRMEMAKLEIGLLPPKGRLAYIVRHLPEMLPFPFSGIIALQAGNGPIVQASHYPDQPEFTTDQPFNALSIGKVFTATAVMQLIETGKFSLKTPLSVLLTDDEFNLSLRSPYLGAKPELSALENLKKHANKITLEQLLSHRAGFVARPASKSEGIAEGESWDLNNIGTYSYSNYGYQLLARIIGKYSDCRHIVMVDHVAGFRSHIEERIFKPAGMQGAIREIHSPTKNKPDYFEISKEKREPVPRSIPEPYPHGNGCWRMTAKDLLAFKGALHQPETLISEDSFRIIKNHPSRHLGLWIDRNQEAGRITGYGHPGGGPGMSSFLHTWLTDPPVTAVVLSNYSGSEMVKPELDKLMV